jgi:hypothetical protein
MMKSEMKRQIGRLAEKTLLLVSLGLVAVGASIGPAAADDWHHHGDRYRHAAREQHWRHERWEHRHYYVPPPVYIAPRPRAVYYPPPVMVMPAPGLSIVVPLTIR